VVVKEPPMPSMLDEAIDTDELSRQWRESGYIVLRGIFSRERAARLRAICERVLASWRERDPQTGAAAGPDANCMRHLNHSAYFPASRDGFAELMEAIADERVLAVARMLFAEDPLFRCTSLFMNPLRSSIDGNWHRDSQFLAPDEPAERASVAKAPITGDGVQMQIALVANDDIEYVPGSHLRWDTPEEYAIRRADGCRNNRSDAMPGAVRVALDPGDAVLFNSIGHHRGRYHADRPRRTLMLTYSRRSAPREDYFTDQPWFLEPGYLDGLTPRAQRFFADYVATFSDYWRRTRDA
jgi:ectoine hydroxylase-related dioxygenase (phytanoyl-CoA dioxygenase family)